MNKLISILLPFYPNKKSNDSLRAKLADANNAGVLCYIENSDKISAETLKEQYAETIRIKDKLEDKAKTNVAGITISITLIMGASGLLNTIYTKFNSPLISWLSFLLFSIAVIYMLIAGIMAIGVLINENELYTVQLNSLAENPQTLRDDYDQCIGQNRTKNLIRNNSVYTSYECIRNALVCLFVLLVFVTIPFSLNNFAYPYTENNMSGLEIVYSGSTIASIKENNWQTSIEQTIMQAKATGMLINNQTLGLLSANESLFVKVKLDNETITVLLVEPVESIDANR